MSSRSQANVKARLVIGWHSCLEAISVRPQEIIKIYLEENKSTSKAKNEFSDKYEFLNNPKLKSKVIYKPRSFFESWGSGHQGLAVEINSLEPQFDIHKIKKKNSVILALDEVEDPTNLGNLIRTGWLLGVDGIFVTQDRSVKLTPQVCKIASGGAEHVPVEIVHPLSKSLEDLKELGYWVYGLDAKAEKTLFDIDFPDKVVLVAGNEGKGLRKTTQNVCDDNLKIPQVSDKASLNVATSLAITLSHVQRSFFKS